MKNLKIKITSEKIKNKILQDEDYLSENDLS